MDKLYFLRLIARAIQQPDPEKALKAAFDQIESLGQKPGYEQGFLQFKRFMDEVRRHCEEVHRDPNASVNTIARDLSRQLANGLFQGDQEEDRAFVKLIMSRPDWFKQYELIWGETQETEAPLRSLEVIVEKDGKLLDSFEIKEKSFTKEMRDIKPGNYVIKLDTGRIIWQDRLTERDLLWVYAFPGQDLLLAADTGDSVPSNTREITLLNGEITLRVYPGIESGRFELEIEVFDDA